MIAVEEAEKIVLDHLHQMQDEEVPVDEAVGRVLSEDIVADRDFPPFNRVMMDGIAINHKVWNEGKRHFSVEGMQTAGSPQMEMKNVDHCMEVMTGAVLPQNTDAVIRYEDVVFEEDQKHFKVNIDEVTLFQNIHLKGTDRKRKDVLIEKGRIITAAEIATMATVGKSLVKVKKRPVIGLVSTGDELVNIEETPHPYQIRKSNIHALKASLVSMFHDSESFHFKDEKTEVEKGLKQVFEKCDVVILSGGVSKGKKDYVPEVLEKLKVDKHFHRVLQRPGKPFWFGTRADGKTVFALPGNPVSTFMCFYKYVKPWLLKSYGLTISEDKAVLSEDFNFHPALTYYLQVKISITNEGIVEAQPVKGQGSGDLANLLDADAFLELPADQEHYKEGEVFPLIRYR